MKIAQSFTIARSLEQVWTSFHDIEGMAECLPGAEVTSHGPEGQYGGKITVKLGPFTANFEGEAIVRFNELNYTGQVEGKGVNRRDNSRSRLNLEFSANAEGEDTTKVVIDADVSLFGAIAQFGRTSLLQETANIFIGEFAKNLEARLASQPSESGSPRAIAASKDVRAISLVLRALFKWLRKIFGAGR